MRFILEDNIENGLKDLSQRLIQELTKNRNVLWLVSGGSNIQSAVKVMATIPAELQMQLTIMLVDERFGDVGHDNSNHQQLLDAGFNPGEAILLSILELGLSLEETVSRFKSIAGQAFEEADTVIALIGIGADGHIAGILPNSPASYESEKYVVGYEAETYKRLTLTFPALRRISAAYVFAYGESKVDGLKRLMSKELTLDEQPAQILKELPEAYVYNDHIDN